MKSRSITRQTVAIVLLAQITFALVLGVIAILSERNTRLRALDQQIAGRLDSLLGAIQDAEDPEDNITIDPAEVDIMREDRYAVYSESGKLIGRSADHEPALPAQGEMGLSRHRIDRLQYHVLRRNALRIIDRAENHGIGLRRPVVIVYASPENHVLHEVFEAVGRLLVAIVLVSAAAAFVTASLVRKTLQPIRDLSLAAQSVSSTSLQFDSPHSAMQVDELRPLATTLSALIDELREAFAKEQRFVGDAAHELKTAVAVVRSAVQVLMLRRRTEQEYVAGLDQLLQDNDRVEALVASMLDLARFEQAPNGKAPLLDLADAAREACATMESIAETHGVRLVVEDEAYATTHLSMDRVQTLLTNLLSNAIRHSSPGGTVTVATKLQDGHAVIEVIDEGSGIPAHALPHVFDRFYRADPSRSRASGGTGLGLAICKSIVESAGGRIDITSTVGKGTRVRALFITA
ncbi:signal transduction histidine kinase [Terriglobus roseus DSM 18391]|uniref:histidine kinase n=1 Tax=Terriglobus roseus (strain DSM 18391 / NRRL B-41598 / KBS 63) TaxID=926566 RepID=I3ZGZ2_TERRK|nr:ATP-binding protein [Terriglobus roseus]AFL88510.1 signal transduction histidine kinase [Terriglobus roseus DSM 18391]AFL88850.1 signal transduction histidine kinase [Terriglobus roseus DSM 18391]